MAPLGDHFCIDLLFKRIRNRPVAPPGASWRPWAIIFVLICYSNVLEIDQLRLLAPLYSMRRFVAQK
jgi:hypothetical protein